MNADLDERARILDRITIAIRDVIGEEYLPPEGITLDTSFNQGLEFESIELVALVERLQQDLGPHIDFVAWFQSKTLDELIELRVGEFVEFIAACPASSSTM